MTSTTSRIAAAVLLAGSVVALAALLGAILGGAEVQLRLPAPAYRGHAHDRAVTSKPLKVPPSTKPVPPPPLSAQQRLPWHPTGDFWPDWKVPDGLREPKTDRKMAQTETRPTLYRSSIHSFGR